MIFRFILFIHVLFVAAEHRHDSEYCDISTKNCEVNSVINSNDKMIFYDVNPPEGFNLRRDVYMRFAIMLAEARKRGLKTNWRLILPPWYRLYHWRAIDKPIAWRHYFDIESLKSYAPVSDLEEVFSEINVNKLEIDTLYVLKNFADAFEGGVFVEKWRVDADCEYDGEFWGYNNVTAKEIVCVRFQGKISQLWEIMALHPNDKRIMFAHGEIPLHDSYGTKSFWECRKSMKFNHKLVEQAKIYISDNFNCDTDMCTTYIGVHWRRRDFAINRKNDIPSIAGTAKQIDDAIKKLNKQIKRVFIATDAKMSELEKLGEELKQLDYEMYYYMPDKAQLDKYNDGGIAIIDQIICSHSYYFIGTHESTFTFRIQEEREILGFHSSMTFNRLCPDSGRCEKPSKWQIIH